MVAEIRSEHESEWAAMGRGAQLLGIGTPETARVVPVGRGLHRGEVTSEDLAELKRLTRENAELKRADAILKSASAFSRPNLDRPLH